MPESALSRALPEQSWGQHRKMAQKIQRMYEKVGTQQAARIAERMDYCATDLVFAEVALPDGGTGRRLQWAHFCRNRLCPICAWRRSLKAAGQTRRIVERAMEQEPEGRWVFLTLTVRNVDASGLADALGHMQSSWRRIAARLAYKQAYAGAIRTLEVTYNAERGDYHPHFHVLLLARPGGYISQGDWVEMWRQSAGLDYGPIVDIRAVSDPLTAVPEIAKYATKLPEIAELSEGPDVLWTLTEALQGRRLMNRSGILREIAAQLRLDDAEDGDLVHVDDEEAFAEGEAVCLIYRWTGCQYITTGEVWTGWEARTHGRRTDHECGLSRREAG